MPAKNRYHVVDAEVTIGRDGMFDYEKLSRRLAYVVSHKQWSKVIAQVPEERQKFIRAFGL